MIRYAYFIKVHCREGRQCDKCIPLGGCANGGCTKPFECNCNLSEDLKSRGKYTGVHCDMRKQF